MTRDDVHRIINLTANFGKVAEMARDTEDTFFVTWNEMLSLKLEEVMELAEVGDVVSARDGFFELAGLAVAAGEWAERCRYKEAMKLH